MAEYILFDLDGTLTDPKEGITKCVQYALDYYGIAEPNLDKLCKFIGPPLASSFAEYYGFDKERSLEAVNKYRERYTDIGIYENKLYDGVKEMLSILKESGKKLAIASSKPEIFCERIAKHFQIESFFEGITGSLLNGDRTNKSEVIREALKRFQNPAPSNVIMVGDRLHDVEGARAEGIACVGVTFGYGGREELEAAKAAAVVDTVEELTSCLLKK